MFTGIIETVGYVARVTPLGRDLRVQVHAELDWARVKLGDSIATNGVCLTVVQKLGNGFVADVSVETLEHTTIGGWSVNQRVNIEQALTPASRLGGHIVSGHVDGLGEVMERHSDARSERFTIRMPADLARYVATKGSITVDGTSLTVNSVTRDEFCVNIVPHTLSHTIMGDYRVGTRVNLEVDLIARYLERLITGSNDSQGSSLTPAFLAEHGFMR